MSTRIALHYINLRLTTPRKSGIIKFWFSYFFIASVFLLLSLLIHSLVYGYAEDNIWAKDIDTFHLHSICIEHAYVHTLSNIVELKNSDVVYFPFYLRLVLLCVLYRWFRFKFVVHKYLKYYYKWFRIVAFWAVIIHQLQCTLATVIINDFREPKKKKCPHTRKILRTPSANS